MRGKNSVTVGRNGMYGITPAYAGKKLAEIDKSSYSKDPPRLCGEKLASIESYNLVDGITPAYAGKNSIVSAFPSTFKDHPRLCGEKP